MPKNKNLPTNAETMKLLLLNVMEQSLDNMERIRDREWLLRLISQLKNPSRLTGQVRNIKQTGVVRKVDELGRLVVPKEVRRTNGIGTGDSVEIYTEGEWIVLEKINNIQHCVLCKSDEDLNPFKGVYVCESCIGELFDTVGG